MGILILKNLDCLKELFISMCFFCVKEISSDMLEEQVSEEIYPHLNEEEYIIMEDSRKDNWRGAAKYGEDNNNINALSWEFYTRDK